MIKLNYIKITQYIIQDKLYYFYYYFYTSQIIHNTTQIIHNIHYL
jgi:hypothetical protein